MRWAWASKLLGSQDRLFQLQQRRERQRRQILRLVDQHLRLVLQRHDLVVDLLQGASGRQHVLRVVIGIEHNQLRGGRLGTDEHSKRNHAGGSETTEAVHLDASNSAEMRDEIGRPGDVAGLQPAGHKVVAAMFGKDLLDQRLVGLGGSCGEGERDLAKTEFEQAIAAARLAVVVALRRRAGEDLDLAVVQSKAPVDRHDLRLDGAVVGQQNPRRTALDDRRRDRRAVDIRKRLGSEDDGSILLAKGLQPLTQLTSKFLVIKRQPPFIDDEQGWPAIKPSFNAVEQIGKDGRRDRRTNQSVGLKDLDGAFAKALEFRIKQPAIGPTEAIGLESALQYIRLKKNAKAGQGPLLESAQRPARSAPTRDAPWLPA